MAVARGLQLAKRHEELAQMCSRALKRYPRSVELLRLRSEAYRCLALPAQALADLDRIVVLVPRHPDARLTRGAGRRRAFDFRGAVLDAEEILKVDPGSAQAWILAAEGRRNLGQVRLAADCASRAISLAPALPLALVARAKARRVFDLEGALADARAAAVDVRAEGSYLAYAWQGEILRRLGRGRQALLALGRAQELEPQCAWARVLRGETLRDLGRKKQALEDILAGVRLERGCSCAFDFLGREPAQVRGDRELAWVYGCRGADFRKKEAWDAALRDFDRAVRLDGRCFWALAWRGEIRLARGQYLAAVKDLKASLSQYPGYADAHVWLGRALCGLGHYVQAMTAFKRALSLERDHVWALIGSGVCARLRGDERRAGLFLERAQVLAPGLFQASAPRASAV